MKHFVYIFWFLRAIALATAGAAVLGVWMPGVGAYVSENWRSNSVISVRNFQQIAAELGYQKTLVLGMKSKWIICRNDPINLYDPSGESATAATLALETGAGLDMGALSSVAAPVAFAYLYIKAYNWLKNMVAPGPSVESLSNPIHSEEVNTSSSEVSSSDASSSDTSDVEMVHSKQKMDLLELKFVILMGQGRTLQKIEQKSGYLLNIQRHPKIKNSELSLRTQYQVQKGVNGSQPKTNWTY